MKPLTLSLCLVVERQPALHHPRSERDYPAAL